MKVLIAFLLCAFSLHLSAQQKDSLKLEMKNMGPLVNSASSDYAPHITADGSTMIFTSRRIVADAISPATNNKKPVQKNTEKKEGNENIYITYYNSKNQTWLEPKLLEPVVNLVGVDNSAIALSNDGQRMLLYRGGNNKNIYKGIFETTLKGNDWSVPIRLPSPINGDGYETTASYSPDGKTIYFVSSRLEGIGGQDIWSSTRDESENWGEAINLGDLINTKEDEESVFMHPNGSTLFFSSKGHNSIGGYDIFMSNFDTTANAWGKPESLGSSINTPGDDLYFVIAANERTAYYAASRPKGVGEKDLYSIRIRGEIIKQHVALIKGFVIDENGLGVKSKIVVTDKASGTIVNTLNSNKATGKYLVALPIKKEYEINVTDENNGTFYESVDVSYKTSYTEIVKNIVLEPKFATISSNVLDEKGNPMGGVQIELIDVTTMQFVGKFETNRAGEMHLSVPFEKKYNIVLSKPGYLFQTVNLTVPKSNGSETKVLNNITMQNVEVGKKVVLNNIYFDFNQSIPKQETFLDLDRVVKLMDDMKSLQLEISGHTDNIGFQDNKKLSEQKAKSVVKYLTRKGLAKKRLKYKGYGPSEPIATNETEEGRLANNRIEIKVLKVDLAAEEKRIKENMANAKTDEPINLTEEKQNQENKDTTITAVKKDENIDAAKEEKVEENKETTITAVKKDEKIDAAKEEKVEENKETTITAVKKDENIDAAKEEKVEENKETTIAAVKKDESIDVAKEEKVEENKETTIAAVKKDESIDVAKEEKVEENKETTIAAVKKDESIDAAKEEKVEENKETNVSVVKKDEKIDATKEEKVQENKETNVTAVKKDESIDAAKEEKVQENKETNVTAVKKDESIDAAKEEKVQENKETNVTAVKKDESIDAAKEEKVEENKETNVTAVKKDEKIEVGKEEKVEENKETNVTAVKKVENIDTAEEEKVEENKETTIAAVKKDESIDAAKEEKVEENKETTIAAVKKDEKIDAAKEEKVEENKETTIAAIKKDEIIDAAKEEKVEENKETNVTVVKKDDSIDSTNAALIQKNKELTKKIEILEQKYNERIDSVAKVIHELKTQENKEANVAAVKKDENIDTADEEKVQENKEVNVAAVKKDESNDNANEEKVQENKEVNVAAVKKDESIDNANEEKVQENKEVNLTTVKKDENIDNANEEKVQENKETNIAAFKKEENIANEEKTQENKEANVTSVKKEENIDTANVEKVEETKEANVAAVKKDESIDTANVEKTQENKETNTTVVKKDESIEDANKEKLREFKKTIEASVNQNDSLNSKNEISNSTKEEHVQEKKESNTLLPDRFKKFDTDINGIISYEEIINMIDSFFENDPNVKGEDIVAAIDYFFGN